ncbi:hypothetical protein L1049_001630 [Liquidambar formosana]|uniref:Uncharacterized protein n=1 Tax=Liquidambar formosana TaxID=63359 RepID=A0AAP0R4Q5_LIQFO
MAASNSHNKPHFPLQNPTSSIRQKPISPSKSYTHFFCKSLLVVAFLIVLPLFPSQAPEFVNLSILTKFWDLLRLLFVGIVVSYGLFSRRNDEVGMETHSNIDNSLSNMSRMFHVSPISEDGFENSSGSEEKKMVQTWNSQYFTDESADVVGDGSSVLDERSKPQSLNSKDGVEFPSGFDEKAMQTWNYKYFQGESMVAVANGSYVLDEWGNADPITVNRPLGLPIRSLRSKILDPDDIPRSKNGSGSGSSLTASSKSSGTIKNRKLGDMGPLNLEENFEETVALPSPIPWRSRSGRMEMREEVGNFSYISHSMPLSAEEYQFEQLKSNSFRSTRSFSSRTSSVTSSPSKLSPSSSVSSEPSNSKMEELERKKSSRGSSTVVFPSPSTLINSRRPPLIKPNSRGFSVGSSSEINMRSSFEYELKDFSKSRREDPSGSKECGLGSLKADAKPATLVKASLRGKSVRTIRAGERTAEAKNDGDIRGSRIDDEVGKTFNEVEVPLTDKTGMRTGRLKNLSADIEKLNHDKPCPMPKPTFSKYQKGEKQNFGENSIAKSEEDSESEDDNFQVSSDEEERGSTSTVNDAGLDTNEVDKKAGEFIAKFKEQIRLQKLHH